ncbi:MAG: hypothetical protein LBK06_09635 [Planctomycetaceae bacterium]|jgi:hypothetical protein|nr:hypothetical protein [Planctomycetaceae bacterium]
MKIQTNIIFLTLAASIIFVPFVNARTWTAKNGYKIEGDFVKFEDGMVNIDLPNGKTADVKLDQLCEDDQKFVKLQTEKKDDSPFVIINSPSKPEQETKNEIKIDDKIINNNTNTVTSNTVIDQEKADLINSTNESDPPVELPFIRFAGNDSAFSSDSKLIAIVNINESGGAKTTTTFWDVTTGKKKFVLKGEQPIFSPDGNYIVTAFQDWETQKYNNRLRRMRSRREIPKDAVPMSLSWLKIWNAKTGQEIKELEIDRIYFAFSDNGKSIMVDGYLWSFPNGKRERKLNSEDEFENKLKAKKVRSNGSETKSPTKFFSNDDKLYVTGDSKKNISQLYDNTTDKILHTFKGVTPRFSPDNKTITTEEEKTSYLWDIETGKVLYKFQGKAPTFSPNSQLIATHDEENIIRLYNLDPQSLDLPSLLSSDESVTTTLNNQTEPQQYNRPRQQRGRKVDVDDVGRAVDTGLRIYNVIRSFSR